MAEKSDTDSSKKIACRSRKAVNFINETLVCSLNVCLQNDAQRTTEERSRYIKKFKEVFEKVSQQNIIVKGEAGDKKEANTTPVYEPKDKQKEEHISEELLPRLDDCVVKIAKRRKRLPHVCASAVTDFSNHQATYMSKVKPKAQPMDLDSTISHVKDVTCFIHCQQLQKACANLAQLTKTASRDKHRADHLQKAVEIEISNRNSQTASVVHGRTPLGDNGLHSVHGQFPPKRKLDCSVFNASSKLPRLGDALAKDFVVQPLNI